VLLLADAKGVLPGVFPGITPGKFARSYCPWHISLANCIISCSGSQ